MGLIIAAIGVGFTLLFCSRRFHDFLLNRYELYLHYKKQEQAAACRRHTSTAPQPAGGARLRWGLQGAAVLVFLCSLWFGLSFVHHNIIPLPMASQILAAFDPDAETWEAKIEQGEYGDLGATHENWSEERGHGYEHSRYWQEELWANWQTYLHAGIFLLFLLLLALGLLLNYVRMRFAPADELHAEKEPAAPKKRKRRKTKIRRSKIRVLGPETMHKAITKHNLSKHS